MAIDYARLRAFEIPAVEQHLSRRDTMLYALGVGLGADPCDEAQLRFVYEKDLVALPSMAIVLGYPGIWHGKYPELGITAGRTVHGEQSFRLARALPVEGTLLGKTRITGIIDKGAARNALVMTETVVREKASGAIVCVLDSTMVCRGDGGFGGPEGPVRSPHPLPESAPELACELATLPQAALIYRLSGDYNPLHADPRHARKAGFDRPILHGRCTFSIVAHALLKTVCAYDPDRLVAMAARFSAPVYPGETIRTEMWRAGGVVSFRATVPARGVTVLDNGRAEVR